MYQLTHQDNAGAASELVKMTGFPSALAAAAGYPGTVGAQLDDRPANYSSKLAGAGKDDLDGQRGSLIVDLKVGDCTITSRTGYTTSDADTSSNVAMVPGIYGMVVLPPYTPLSQSRNEDNVDASPGISYKLAPTVLLHGSIGQGSKRGLRPVGVLPGSVEILSPTRAHRGARFKNQFDDRRLTVKAAAFWASSVGASYEPTLSDGLRHSLQTDLAYKSDQAGQRNQANVVRVPTSQRLRASGSLETPDGASG